MRNNHASLIARHYELIDRSEHMGSNKLDEMQIINACITDLVEVIMQHLVNTHDEL